MRSQLARARSRANSPFRPPFKVELVIKLKTAKAFGLTGIEFVLLLADEVDRENFFAVRQLMVAKRRVGS